MFLSVPIPRYGTVRPTQPQVHALAGRRIASSGRLSAIAARVQSRYPGEAKKSIELRYVLEQSDSAALFLTEGVKDANFVEILEDAIPDLADSEPREPEAERLPYLAPPHPSQRVLDPDRVQEPRLDSCEMGHAPVGLCWGFGDQRPVDCAAGRSAGTVLDFRSSLLQILVA
jgi:hypothetical protein